MVVADDRVQPEVAIQISAEASRNSQPSEHNCKRLQAWTCVTATRANTVGSQHTPGLATDNNRSEVNKALSAARGATERQTVRLQGYRFCGNPDPSGTAYRLLVSRSHHIEA